MRFELTSPVALVQTEGAEFRVDVDATSGRTRVEVTTGAVTVSAIPASSTATGGGRFPDP